MAWINRALLNSYRRPRRYDGIFTLLPVSDIRVPSLTSKELTYAKLAVWREVQRSCFKNLYEALSNGEQFTKEDFGDFRELSSKWDPKSRLIRVVGRVQPFFKSLRKEAPILLPADHHAVDLYIRWTHERRRHAGVQNTFLFLREECWILRGR